MRHRDPKRLKAIIIILGVFIFSFLYYRGAILRSREVNTDITSGDQTGYINYVKKMVKANYAYEGERNRMPLYPFIQSLFYSSGMKDEEFFRQGKVINIIISINQYKKEFH